MARTKLSRGVKAFQLKSGNTTPYPFLGKIGKGIKNLFSKTPVGMAAEAVKGGGAGKGFADMNTKIDEIHSALVGEEGGDTMMTKQTHMYHKPHHTDKQVDPNTGKKHYHSARYTGELEGRKPE